MKIGCSSGLRIDRIRSMLLLVGTVLSFSGCGESEKPRICAPEVPAGRLQGTITAGTGLTRAVVTANRIPLPGQNSVIATTRPDASGNYGLDVPAGRYTIGLADNDDSGRALIYDYTVGGLRCHGTASPDTVQIDESHSPEIDFIFGSVHLGIAVSASLDGERVETYLRGSGTRVAPYQANPYSASAEIAQGTAEITMPFVLPGSYRLEIVVGRRYYLCYCPYDGEHFWYPGVRDSSASPPIDVVASIKTELAVVLDPNPARIEGVVTGAWQTLGKEPPEIALLAAADSSVVMGQRRIGDDGSFGVDVYVPCPIKVMVSQDGIQQWIGGLSFQEAETFILEHGRTVSGLRFVQSGMRLELAGSSDTGFAAITLFDSARPDLPIVFAPGEQMGGQRVFGICNLRAGSYVLSIRPSYLGWDPWLAQWYDRSETREGALPILIPDVGMVAPVQVTLVDGGRITGRILDAPQYLGEHWVYFTAAGDSTLAGNVPSLQSDGFEVRGLPDGEWKIGASRRAGWDSPEAPPPGTIWFPGTTDWSAAHALSIRDHGSVEGIEIVFP